MVFGAASAVAMFVALLAAIGIGQGRPAPSLRPSISVAALPTPEPERSIPPFTVHLDHSVPAGVRDPTAHKAQSKLWFAHGAWWAVMATPERRALTIHRLDLASQTWIDTLTLVDERPNANADARWDGEALVVATAVKSSGSSGAARILRYHFDPVEGRFDVDNDFPVRISDAGVEGIVVARDSLGVLWVAFMQDRRVYVSHSTTNDAVWVKPVALPWPSTVTTPDDIASVVAFGPGRIGVLWTNQRTGAVLFTSRRDGDPDDVWDEPVAALEGQDLADDHLNAKVAADGRLFVAVKTSLDEPAEPNPESPLTVLLERHPDGTWSRHQFGRVRDHHTRPIILIDDRAGLVYMIAASPTVGGTIYVKWSSLDAIEFPSGLGVPLIPGTDGAVIVDPTSTKSPVDAEAGFVILAFDRANERYVHAVIGGPGGPSDSPWPSGETNPATVYFADTFEPWTTGAAPGNGWELRDPVEGRLTIASDPAHGQIAVLAAAGAGDTRACKSFTTLDGRPLTAEVSVRPSGVGAADIVGLALRGSGGDVASIRFGQGGTFSYYDGPTKIRSDIAYVPGRWYRLRATVDLGQRTAKVEIVDESTRTTILSAADLGWRIPDVEKAGTACVQAPGGPGAPSLSFDDVSVSQR